MRQGRSGGVVGGSEGERCCGSGDRGGWGSGGGVRRRSGGCGIIGGGEGRRWRGSGGGGGWVSGGDRGGSRGDSIGQSRECGGIASGAARNRGGCAGIEESGNVRTGRSKGGGSGPGGAINGSDPTVGAYVGGVVRVNMYGRAMEVIVEAAEGSRPVVGDQRDDFRTYRAAATPEGSKAGLAEVWVAIVDVGSE